MTTLPLSASMPILERWAMAASRLPAAVAREVTNQTAPQIARIVVPANLGSLAYRITTDGPGILANLTRDERVRLLPAINQHLPPAARLQLQTEAVQMEQLLGRLIAFRLVVFGEMTDPALTETILNLESPDRRITTISLEPPTTRMRSRLERIHHQILWPVPEAASPAPESDKALSVSPLPRKMTRVRPQESETWNIDKFARLQLPGTTFTAFAGRAQMAMESGEILRIGGLAFAAIGSKQSPEPMHPLPPIADIVFASGAILVHGQPSGGTTRSARNAFTVALGSARDSYAVIDFDPQTSELHLVQRDAFTQSSLKETTIPLEKRGRVRDYLQDEAKDGVKDGLADEIAVELAVENPQKRRLQSLLQAGLAINHVLPFAASYLEWLERNPEALMTAREKVLRELQEEMRRRIPKDFMDKRYEQVTRHLYKAFGGFLEAWGMTAR